MATATCSSRAGLCNNAAHPTIVRPRAAEQDLEANVPFANAWLVGSSLPTRILGTVVVVEVNERERLPFSQTMAL